MYDAEWSFDKERIAGFDLAREAYMYSSLVGIAWIIDGLDNRGKMESLG